MNLGKSIRLCRTQRGYSQGDLAKRVGCSVSYLSLLENNQRDPPLSTLKEIASALAVPLSIMLFLASDPAEIKGMDKELAKDLSQAALELLREPIDELPQV